VGVKGYRRVEAPDGRVWHVKKRFRGFNLSGAEGASVGGDVLGALLVIPFLMLGGALFARLWVVEAIPDADSPGEPGYIKWKVHGWRAGAVLDAVIASLEQGKAEVEPLGSKRATALAGW
jgi:hypothetical protein